MDTLFGILSVELCLEILCIGIGLWWQKSVFHKPIRTFVSGRMVGWKLALAENHPSQSYGNLIKEVVGGNATIFSLPGHTHRTGRRH